MADLILWIQAGWVGVALIAVACIPTLRADYLQKSAKEGTVATNSSAKSSNSKPVAEAPAPDRAHLFTGGSESLVARTVGHAEGTRTPDGRRTRAYYGHTDPGNGVWNLGSFSFQHCREAEYSCSTPEQADDHQLRRLQMQDATLHQRTKNLNFELTLEEEINGIDLANQAPLAALSEAGYADHLLQAKQKGLSARDAILEARVWSFWNPQTQQWDAPGLGNTESSIRHDQKRRLMAIVRVLALYQQQIEQPTEIAQSSNLLNLNPDVYNPYSFDQQKANYLWWDAGFWDGKLNQQRQIPSGEEPAYDEGFEEGSSSVINP